MAAIGWGSGYIIPWLATGELVHIGLLHIDAKPHTTKDGQCRLDFIQVGKIHLCKGNNFGAIRAAVVVQVFKAGLNIHPIILRGEVWILGLV